MPSLVLQVHSALRRRDSFLVPLLPVPRESSGCGFAATRRRASGACRCAAPGHKCTRARPEVAACRPRAGSSAGSRAGSALPRSFLFVPAFSCRLARGAVRLARTAKALLALARLGPPRLAGLGASVRGRSSRGSSLCEEVPRTDEGHTSVCGGRLRGVAAEGTAAAGGWDARLWPVRGGLSRSVGSQKG